MSVRLSILVVLLALAGCRTESPDEAGAAPEAEGAEPFELTEPEPIADAETTTQEVELLSVIPADPVCYLRVTASGEEQMLTADLELCPDAQTMAGQTVTITQRPAMVGAASCAGEPDCPEPEEVGVVINMVAAE